LALQPSIGFGSVVGSDSGSATCPANSASLVLEKRGSTPEANKAQMTQNSGGATFTIDLDEIAYSILIPLIGPSINSIISMKSANSVNGLLDQALVKPADAVFTITLKEAKQSISSHDTCSSL
jgi:hypothetical protein